jgi:excisionase family DNA binding protein
MADPRDPALAERLGELPLLTQRDVAQLFQVETRTVRRWVAEGRLRQVNPGGGRVVRYRRADVERLLAGDVE